MLGEYQTREDVGGECKAVDFVYAERSRLVIQKISNGRSESRGLPLLALYMRQVSSGGKEQLGADPRIARALNGARGKIGRGSHPLGSSNSAQSQLWVSRKDLLEGYGNHCIVVIRNPKLPDFTDNTVGRPLDVGSPRLSRQCLP